MTDLQIQQVAIHFPTEIDIPASFDDSGRYRLFKGLYHNDYVMLKQQYYSSIPIVDFFKSDRKLDKVTEDYDQSISFYPTSSDAFFSLFNMLNG